VSEIDPKLSRLYREASSEGPPAALDAVILAAARKQVAKPQRRARSAWVRWMAPASAIATLVLGVSIALLVEREQPDPTRDMSIHPIRPLPQSAPPARATESAKPKAAGSAAPGAAANKEAAAAPAQAPVPAAPAQVPVLAAPAPAPATRRAEPAPPAAQAFPAENRAKAAESRMAAPKAATEPNVAGDSALGGASAAAPAAPAAAGKLAPLRQQAMQRSPEAWLDEIGRLRREGRDKEAAEQLAEFRKAYPAHAVPESLLLK
jgi:hypothetical protein